MDGIGTQKAPMNSLESSPSIAESNARAKTMKCCSEKLDSSVALAPPGPNDPQHIHHSVIQQQQLTP